MRRALAALWIVAAGPALAEDGAALYAEYCAACHRPEGQGTAGLAPPLVSGVLKRAGEGDALAYVPRVILEGLWGPIVSEGQHFVSAMPGHATLTDAEVAAIATHVLGGLNGLAVSVTQDEVASLRANAKSHAALRALRQSFAP